MDSTPTAVITGATSGLGRLVALDLARRGYRLLLTARSAEKAAELRGEILGELPHAEVDFVIGDLSLVREVRRLAVEIAARCDHLDVLINNAGLHGFAQRITAEGLPEMMAVNYLAPWVLTRELGPLLGQQGESRVVFLASEAAKNHAVVDVSTDLTDTRPFTARASSPLYGKSKLFDLAVVGELARRWADRPVKVLAVCPGFNVTGLGRELGFAKVLSRILNTLRIGDPGKGAAVIVNAAVAAPSVPSGTFLTARLGGPTAPPRPAGDLEFERALWVETEVLVARTLGKATEA